MITDMTAATKSTCQAVVHRSINRGVMSKGTDSTRTLTDVCGKACPTGATLCTRHAVEAAKNAVRVAQLREERSR